MLTIGSRAPTTIKYVTMGYFAMFLNFTILENIFPNFYMNLIVHIVHVCMSVAILVFMPLKTDGKPCIKKIHIYTALNLAVPFVFRLIQ